MPSLLHPMLGLNAGDQQEQESFCILGGCLGEAVHRLRTSAEDEDRGQLDHGLSEVKVSFQISRV